tara:strand:- start:235 stop:606 length:372 start_codon:yes stop_codon:yes gene_type:complete
MKVEVYFNLHKQLFSVRSCKTGRVIEHTTHVHLDSPVFIVRQSGRKRVLREGKKNVHAFVRGYRNPYLDWALPDGYPVGYNPYKFDSFVNKHTHDPVHFASKAAMLVLPNNKPVIRVKQGVDI